MTDVTRCRERAKSTRTVAALVGGRPATWSNGQLWRAGRGTAGVRRNLVRDEDYPLHVRIFTFGLFVNYLHE